VISSIKNILAWLKRNEHHLWTALFFGGFATDLFALTHAPISLANTLFSIYLVIVILGYLANQYLYARGLKSKEGLVIGAINFIFHFMEEFFIGSLLSGFLIFYTKSASVLVSWPFILLLAGIFLGNEIFKEYKKHLTFQAVLIFFCIYAYLIFALPLALGKMGPQVFLESGAISIITFLIFLLLLGLVNFKGLKGNSFSVIGGVIAIFLLINISYFTGVLPPLPLALTEAGAYHTVTRTGDQYVLVGEATSPWWKFQPTIVHLIPGDSLSIFSSVFAPIAFSSTEVHKWEMYNDSTHKWDTRAEIAFSINGGRSGGYRGYSTISAVQPGKYRVLIETLSGQVIGTINFTVVSVPQEPSLGSVTE
jgi:MFS family permease